ncbi:MAG: hypothetical protein HFE62_04875, partial [Firmicutes bacterium]|nr:hypothetical protein [Bacillota bacterium]MCI8342527.1 hypothetical protein [Bacillota bacterium]
VNRQGIIRPVDDQEDVLCGDLKTLVQIIKGMYYDDCIAEGKEIERR